jgi:hypothetical protein
MKVGIVTNNSGAIYIKAALAFSKLFDKCFVTSEDQLSPELDSCDCFIVIGNYFKNYKVYRAGPVKRFVYDSGKPFVVVTGSLINDSKNPSRYIRLNVNGFTNNFGMMPPSDLDRLAKIKKEIGLTTAGKHIRGDKIVVAPNALASPMMFGKDVDHWLYLLIDELLQITDRPIQLRYHRKKIIDHSKWSTKLFNQFGNKIDIYVDQKNDNGPLEDAYCAITYNSTFSVMSLLSGTSNVTRHEGNFVYDITKHDLTEESFEYYPEYDQLEHHFGKLANMEWTVGEIEDGTAWKVLAPMFEENIQLNRDWL